MAANAYGFLEVTGLVPGIEAADAMLKTADVRLVVQLTVDPGFITLVVEGDIGSCSAALDAGCAAAHRAGRFVSARLIGRPEPDIDLFLGRTAPRRAVELPKKPPPTGRRSRKKPA